jgi:hypothetical protein
MGFTKLARTTVLTVVLAAATVGCAGSRGGASLGDRAKPNGDARSPALGFPVDAGRSASTVLEVPGNSPIQFAGGQPSLNGQGIVLTAFDPGLMNNGMAFAVYMFTGLPSEPVALRVETISDYKASYWLGMANWRNGSWDWSPGSFRANGVISPRDYANTPNEYLSPNGAFAVAVVLVDDAEPVEVKTLKITIADELESVSATIDRWDAVRLEWVGSSTSDGFRILKRLAGDESASWTALAGFSEVIGRYDDYYKDLTGFPNVDYEFLVQQAINVSIQGDTRTFWSQGLTTTGRRLGTADNGSGAGVANHFAVNLGNRLSFLYTPGSVNPAMEVLQADAYPPSESWVHYGVGEGGVDTGPLASSMEQLPAPVALLSESSTNNPLVTTAYSNADGPYSQIATINNQNEVTFEEPVPVRPGESNIHILGMTKLPIKNIMAIMWNGVANRLEMMQTFDQFGRVWYIFDPNQAPWQIVSGKRPNGPVDLRCLNFPVYVVFSEQESNDCLVMYLNDGWHDVSPGVKCSPGPQIRQIQLENFAQGKALYYLTEDRSQIRVLRDAGSGWLLGDPDETVAVSAPAGEQIQEFDLHTHGDQSFENYLVYVMNGKLYMSYSSDSPMRLWSDPILIDPATDCRNPGTVMNGTDDTFTTYLFATYIRNDDAGVPRINFRDLRLAYEEAQSD